jgi:hypothetical protein
METTVNLQFNVHIKSFKYTVHCMYTVLVLVLGITKPKQPILSQKTTNYMYNMPNGIKQSSLLSEE